MHQWWAKQNILTKNFISATKMPWFTTVTTAKPYCIFTIQSYFIQKWFPKYLILNGRNMWAAKPHVVTWQPFVSAATGQLHLLRKAFISTYALLETWATWLVLVMCSSDARCNPNIVFCLFLFFFFVHILRGKIAFYLQVRLFVLLQSCSESYFLREKVCCRSLHLPG